MSDLDEPFLLPELAHRVVIVQRSPWPEPRRLAEAIDQLLARFAVVDGRLSNWHGYDEAFALQACATQQQLTTIVEQSELESLGPIAAGPIAAGPIAAGATSHRFRLFNLSREQDYADVYCGFSLSASADTPGMVFEVRAGSWLSQDQAVQLMTILCDVFPVDVGLFEPAGQEPAAPDAPLSCWVSWGTFIARTIVELPTIASPAIASPVAGGMFLLADERPYRPDDPASRARFVEFRNSVLSWLPRAAVEPAAALATVVPPLKEAFAAVAPPPSGSSQVIAAKRPPRFDPRATIDAAAAPLHALPFREAHPGETTTTAPPAPSSADRRALAQLARHRAAGATVAMDDGLRQLGVIPFDGPAQSNASVAQQPHDVLTLERYAAYYVDCDLTPSQLPQLLQRHGLRDERHARAVSEYWHMEFKRSPALLKRWYEACDAYRRGLLPDWRPGSG